jgi:DNA helicase-2/ATP-dependent DNA helicase PcrA
MIASYLDPLNPEQRRAVLHTGKPLLILAGAGSGKTRVITTKIAWLIREQAVDPRSILAVTFTNKAAREMAERARQIDERASGTMLRTFHSFGAWFLRRNGSLAGLDSNFIIYDDDDVVSLLSTIMENAPKAEVKEYAHNISRAKDYFFNPDDPALAKIEGRKRFRSIYARYESRMAEIGNVDFGDLIKKPVEILRGHPEVARRFQDRFKVIMVDEYQDTNVAQFQLLKELCGPDTYVCVVGDDDQSIYKFRGAEVKNILEFPDRFSGTDIIRLESNYRSTAPILKAASSVVDYNKGRLGKTLRAERGGGALPSLAQLPDQDEEAAYCASLIEDSVKKKQAAFSDWAILYRTNAQSLGFETLFLRKGIPYRVIGSLKFYEREEIKDALALLSFLVNPRDEVAFRRVVNKPTRGVGPVTIDNIVAASAECEGNLMEAGRKLTVPAKARSGLDTFFKVIESTQLLLYSDQKDTADKPKQSNKKKLSANKGLISGEGLSACIVKLVKDSGIAGYHENQDDIAGSQKLNNLQELVNAASVYRQSTEGLLEFLEHIELDRAFVENSGTDNAGENAVTLITFHNTKGLEFRRVIMTGLEQGVFPREDKNDEELEEERRLFYVGATRAMDELYFTTCAMRRMYGRTMPSQPSLFLGEIDKSCLQINKRKSFSSFRVNSYSGNNFSANKELEDRAGWRRGQRLFNDDHGYGAVMEVRDSGDGPIVRVRFDTGKETRFLSDYQGRSYEKINDS